MKVWQWMDGNKRHLGGVVSLLVAWAVAKGWIWGYAGDAPGARYGDHGDWVGACWEEGYGEG